MASLVVRWDSDINEFGRRVGIAEGYDGNVDIRRFFDSLGVGTRVGDDDKTRFLEGAGDVVGEVTRSEATCNGNSACMSRKFEHCALAIGTGGDNSDISWVVDSSDDSCGEDDLLPVYPALSAVLKRWIISIVCLPSLANVDHIDAIRTSLP